MIDTASGNIYKYIIVEFSDLSISYAEMDSWEVAQETMKRRFADCLPEHLDGEADDLTFIDDWEARIVDNDGNIYYWKIITVVV